MFGFLKNLFGGIFSFLGSLLGFKKSEYVMEFESAPAAAPAAKTQPAKPAATEPTEPAKATVTAPAAAPSPKAEPAKAAALVSGLSSYSQPAVTSARRRPGANMNAFLDMARQVKASR